MHPRYPAIDIDLSAVEWATILIAFGTLASAAILGITAIYIYRSAQNALLALEDARKTRHAELVTDLSRRWDEPLIAESRKLFGKKTAEELVEVVNEFYVTGDNDDEYYKLTAWPNLIETIGVLESDGAISPEVIHQMWGGGIIVAWAGWCDAIQALRERAERPTTYLNFGRLAEMMEGMEPGRVSEAEASGTPGAEAAADRTAHQS
jgi:hypothetical protein